MSLVRCAKKEQIQTEGHSHGFGRARSQRPIDGEQNVLNPGGIKIGRSNGLQAIDKSEPMREGLDSSRYAVAARAAQFDQIAGRGQGNQEVPVVGKDPPEFTCIHPRGDRKND